MEQSDGLHPETEQIQWFAGDQFMRYEGGHEGIVDVLLALEDVLIHPPQMVHRSRLGIDVDRSLHHHVEAADLVKAEGVIDMVVREENGNTSIDALPKSLLAKIGGCIDEYGSGLVLIIDESDGGRSPQSLVPGIAALTHVASTADRRNSRRGS